MTKEPNPSFTNNIHLALRETSYKASKHNNGGHWWWWLLWWLELGTKGLLPNCALHMLLMFFQMP